MRRLGIAIVLLALAGCGGDEEEPRIEETHAPRPTVVKGGVVGRVLDFYQQPIADAEIEVTVEDGIRLATIDDAGFFVVNGIPAGGDVRLEIRAEGHGSISIRANIPAAAGEIPQEKMFLDLGDILLVPLVAELKIPVLGPLGEKILVQGAECIFGPTVLRNYVVTEGHQVAPVEATAGSIRCTELPSPEVFVALDGSVLLSIPAQDLDGDGHAEYEGVLLEIWGEEMVSGEIEAIVLQPRNENFEILRSNVPSFESDGEMYPALAAGSVIEIEFSTPVELLHSRVWNTFKRLDFETSVEVDGTIVRIRPADEWPQGEAVHVELWARPASPVPEAVQYFSAYGLIEGMGAIGGVARFEDSDDDGDVDVNEEVTVVFDEYFVLMSIAIEVAYSVDADLDESGEIGDAPYELGHATRGFISLRPNVSRLVNWGSFTSDVEIPGEAELVLFFDDNIFMDSTARMLGTMRVPLAAGEGGLPW